MGLIRLGGGDSWFQHIILFFYRGRDRCRHFVINQGKSGQFMVSGDTEVHDTLSDLIEYYKTSPIEPFGEFLTSSCYEVRRRSSCSHLHFIVGYGRKSNFTFAFNFHYNYPGICRRAVWHHPGQPKRQAWGQRQSCEECLGPAEQQSHGTSSHTATKDQYNSRGENSPNTLLLLERFCSTSYYNRKFSTTSPFPP